MENCEFYVADLGDRHLQKYGISQWTDKLLGKEFQALHMYWNNINQINTSILDCNPIFAGVLVYYKQNPKKQVMKEPRSGSLPGCRIQVKCKLVVSVGQINVINYVVSRLQNLEYGLTISSSWILWFIILSQLLVTRCYNFVEKLVVLQREGQHSPTTHCYDNNYDLGSYREMSALCSKDTN